MPRRYLNAAPGSSGPCPACWRDFHRDVLHDHVRHPFVLAEVVDVEDVRWRIWAIACASWRIWTSCQGPARSCRTRRGGGARAARGSAAIEPTHGPLR